MKQLRDELDVFRNRFDLLLAENKIVTIRCADLMKDASTFKGKEAMLTAELEEARACSSSNAAVIREQLIVAEATIEVLRKDHASWMLQSHKRQEQLEQSNAELAATLTECQRNIIKLKSGGDRTEKDNALLKEVKEIREQL